MTKGFSIYLLLVGCTWALFTVWSYMALSGISEPVSTAAIVFYYGVALTGPLALVVGPSLILRSESSKSGAILVFIGCAILSAFVLYNGLSGLRIRPLEMPPPLSLIGAMFAVMVLADIAAYKVCKTVLIATKSAP